MAKHLILAAILLVAFLSAKPAWATLDLFPQQPNRQENVAAATVSKKVQAPAKNETEYVDGYRRLAFYIESAISRGDIRFDYEVPLTKSWMGVVLAHINPNASRNKETGSVGILGGARLYLDGKLEGTFVQALAGLNVNSGLEIALDLAAGYTILWKDNLSFDVGIAMFRGTEASQKDPQFTLMVNLAIGLNQPLFPFL